MPPTGARAERLAAAIAIQTRTLIITFSAMLELSEEAGKSWCQIETADYQQKNDDCCGDQTPL